MRIAQTLTTPDGPLELVAHCDIDTAQLCEVSITALDGRAFIRVHDQPVDDWQRILPLIDQAIVSGHYSSHAEHSPVMIDRTEMIVIENFGALTRAQAKLLSRTLHGTFVKAA